MLQVYNYYPYEKYVQNDIYFGEYTYDFIIDEINGAELRKTIERVEGVSFVDNKKFESKFNQEILSLSCLSTGCKTYLNILVSPDIVFDVRECGNNILKEIYLLEEGKIYNLYPIVFSDKDYEEHLYECFSKESHSIIKGAYALRRWYFE